MNALTLATKEFRDIFRSRKKRIFQSPDIDKSSQHVRYRLVYSAQFLARGTAGGGLKFSDNSVLRSYFESGGVFAYKRNCRLSLEGFL